MFSHYIDLSHLITNNIPVFPGTNLPTIEKATSVEKDGFQELEITISSHIGTHIDCPLHIISQGHSTATLSVSQFQGNAVVFDVSKKNLPEIGINDFTDWTKKLKYRNISAASIDFVLIKTNWSEKWGSGDYFKNYPTISHEVANKFVEMNLKGVGIDMISVDPLMSNDLPVHNILLKNGIIIIENLTKLKKIPEKLVQFSCFPLKFKSGDGSPVRAVAMY